MLWKPGNIFINEPFEKETDLEEAIQTVKDALFGKSRIYLDIKKKIGIKGKTRNIPDGYLIDLTSKKEPLIYVVENELAKHDPLKHIAVQILEFSLSFETSTQQVKTILKEALNEYPDYFQLCHIYAVENGFENVDYLLEKMIYKKNAFNALVIIDELSDELEKILISRFQFPVEIITLQKFSTFQGENLYQFEPFLSDVSMTGDELSEEISIIDPSEIDTIVVPARDDGFQEVFIAKDCWFAIRIHSSMIPRIKYIAVYQVAPESAITHIAQVRKIEQYKDTSKYIVYFAESAEEIEPIKLVHKGKVKAPQAPRYTSYDRLTNAKNLDEVF